MNSTTNRSCFRLLSDSMECQTKSQKLSLKNFRFKSSLTVSNQIEPNPLNHSYSIQPNPIRLIPDPIHPTKINSVQPKPAELSSYSSNPSPLDPSQLNPGQSSLGPSNPGPSSPILSTHGPNQTNNSDMATHKLPSNHSTKKNILFQNILCDNETDQIQISCTTSYQNRKVMIQYSISLIKFRDVNISLSDIPIITKKQELRKNKIKEKLKNHQKRNQKKSPKIQCNMKQ